MKANTYSDVLIVPTHSDIESRTDVVLNSKLGSISLKLPVISANMKTVTGPAMVKSMAKSGGLGILHRFESVEDNIEHFCKCQDYVSNDLIGVSVGVKESEKFRIDKLLEYGAINICVDVAHGYNDNVKRMIKWIRNNNKDNITIIAGNVATPDGASQLLDWGADIIKVGIGPGSVCETRRNTGIGVPQLHALEKIRYAIDDKPMIADGGIRNTGDIPKALVYANAVMVGAILAGTIETPGKVYRSDGDLIDRTFYKVYGGSASAENKGENKFVEGKIKIVPFKGHVKYILKEIEEGIQSAFSYVGARNLYEFREKARFIELSSESRIESKI